MRPTVAAGLILAAGASSRMGQSKALLTTRRGGDESFLAALVRAFAAAGCAPLAVVTGKLALPIPEPAREVQAEAWALGMRESLRTGLRALPPKLGVLLTHVDRPVVSSETLRLLLVGDAEVTRVPKFEGAPGHPVYLSPGLCERLRQPGFEPLSELLAASGEPVLAVSVSDPGVLVNINTRAELEAFWLTREP